LNSQDIGFGTDIHLLNKIKEDYTTKCLQEVKGTDGEQRDIKWSYCTEQTNDVFFLAFLSICMQI